MHWAFHTLDLWTYNRNNICKNTQIQVWYIPVPAETFKRSGALSFPWTICTITWRVFQCQKEHLQFPVRHNNKKRVLWNPAVNTVRSQWVYFNLSSLILVCRQTFIPSRHDLIHLVGRCARVCCESGLASLASVSLERHPTITEREKKKIYQHNFRGRVSRRREITSVTICLPRTASPFLSVITREPLLQAGLLSTSKSPNSRRSVRPSGTRSRHLHQVSLG